MGLERTMAGSWEYDWQLGDVPRQLEWLKWRHALLNPPMENKNNHKKKKKRDEK